MAIRAALGLRETSSSKNHLEDFFDWMLGSHCHAIYLSPNVKVMAHSLVGANVDRGVKVQVTRKHGEQRG